MIPVFRMEEHSEAYAIWHIAVEEGLIPASGNVLVHVDHHDDLECGPYDHDFTQPFPNVAQAMEFLRDGLGIADFIAPAFWEGIFDKMVNFKSIFPSNKPPQVKAVALRGTQELILRDYIPLTDSGNENVKAVDYLQLSLNPLPPIDVPVVLDIDIDYFCWDNTLSTGTPARLEITEEAYRAFRTDPRHPCRILAKRIVYAFEKDGRYYMQIRDPAPNPRETRDERIRQRVDKFMAWLKETELQPAVIDICRSRISGYCPSNKWEMVEGLVLEGLREIYPLQLRDDMLENYRA